jgi:CheY-like chemotaxis protein
MSAETPLRPTILIVDDDADLVGMLEFTALRHGLDCVTDTTSKQVLDLIRSHRPAVTILDVHQAVDGRDLLAQIKADPDTRETKVVVISGIHDQFTRHTCLQLGAVDYIIKPLEPFFMRRIARLAGVE